MNKGRFAVQVSICRTTKVTLHSPPPSFLQECPPINPTGSGQSYFGRRWDLLSVHSTAGASRDAEGGGVKGGNNGNRLMQPPRSSRASRAWRRLSADRDFYKWFIPGPLLCTFPPRAIYPWGQWLLEGQGDDWRLGMFQTVLSIWRNWARLIPF